MDRRFGDEYTVIDLGLNGTVSSAVQMQIMGRFLEPGDILFHTPELTSRPQLMIFTGMGDNDSSLWAGLENNYDLFALVNLRQVDGAFNSLSHYLSLKDRRTDYQQFFSDDYRTPYIDGYGAIPFYRSGTAKNLDVSDKVRLNEGNVIAPKAEGAEKKTVYIPYIFAPATEGNSSQPGTPRCLGTQHGHRRGFQVL